VPTTESTRTALLIMDVQPSIVDRIEDAEALLERLGVALAAGRDAGLTIVYVTIGFRSGYPEISPRNRAFAGIADSGAFVLDGSSDIHPAVAPFVSDIVVVKRRVSAFAGSDLDVVLRARDVERLVLSGIATSGVVLSTLRAAADLDFGITVLRDGCADSDPEVHRVLLEKVFPRQAEVVTVDEWVAGLRSA
jgi:nicotinamidase-related amidase